MSDPRSGDPLRHPLRLPELLAARALDDLGGLVGALVARLARADREGRESDEAADLGRRLRLLRAAWGPTDAGLDVARLQDLSLGAPIGLDLSAVPANITFAPAVGRVLLNVILLAAECLPNGGTLALADAGDGDLLATIAGSRAAWPDGFAAVLADEDAAWAALKDPQQLQPPLLALVARALGVRLSLLMPAGAGRRRMPSPLLIGPA